jgi:hypothetical protein
VEILKVSACSNKCFSKRHQQIIKSSSRNVSIPTQYSGRSVGEFFFAYEQHKRSTYAELPLVGRYVLEVMILLNEFTMG